MKVNRYHVTVLSNILLGYNKYESTYSKKNIPESSYPKEFYLLKEDELSIGFEKVQRLLKKLNIKGNIPIVLESDIDDEELYPNLRNGKGEYVSRDWIKVKNIYIVGASGLKMIIVEEVVAKAYALLPLQLSFNELAPRSVSILPVAIGCQADCSFCFSESSISSDQYKGSISNVDVEKVLQLGKSKGASRAVITGGGEPGILPKVRLFDLIKCCSKYFNKVVLITNGYFIVNSSTLKEDINQLGTSGLTTLSISRHHYNDNTHRGIMNLEVSLHNLFSLSKEGRLPFHLRLVCVLQKGGVETKEDILEYIKWAQLNGVSSVCFKELYISSSIESVYYSKDSNEYCRRNQVPLSILTELAIEEDWIIIEKLPWGSPVYKIYNLHPITIAAYTEPSVSWELTHGICRSWNLMADGSCYASLESRESKILM